MSKILVDTIDTRSGTSTLTLGSSNAGTIALGSGDVQSNFLYPAFSAYLNSAQTISASTWTKVGFDAEYFDTNSSFDTSNNRFVVPSNLAGKYCLVGQISMEFIDDNKTFRMNWYKNGASNSVGTMLKSPGANGSFIFENTTILDLAVGDYIELFGFTDNTDTNISFQDGGDPKGSTRFLGFRIGT